MEILVAISLFGVVGSILLGVVISTADVAQRARSMAQVDEDARLIIERMSRELRQARQVLVEEPGRLSFWTDFDCDDVSDEGEVLTYSWTGGTLLLTASYPGTGEAPVSGGATVSEDVVGLEISRHSNGEPLGDAASAAQIDRVGLVLTLDHAGIQREYRTTVALRNHSQQCA